MKDELKKNFESLLKNGEYAEAEKLLVPYMKENPDDWDAKLLYGTCRMMQGDAEAAKQIHDEVEKQIAESGKLPEEQKSFWVKYERLIIYGAIGTALVIGGGYMVKSIVPTVTKSQRSALSDVGKEEMLMRMMTDCKYDGPAYKEPAYEELEKARHL